MWSKFDFNLQVVVFVFVVGATESLGTIASTSGSFNNSSNCTKDHCSIKATDGCLYYNGDSQYQGLPNVTSPYWTRDVVEGDKKMSIYCTIKANPPACLQWLFNGRNIQELINSSFYDEGPKPELSCLPADGTSMLTLFTLSPKLHHGQYACVATNSVGQSNRTFTVDVRAKSIPSPEITCNPDKTAYLGSAFNITCEVQFQAGSGFRNAAYLRAKNIVPDDDRHELYQKLNQLKSKLVMIITNVTMADAGSWEIRAVQFPKNESKFINLEVVPCPKGHFCPINVSSPQPCPAGTYNDGITNITYHCQHCPAYDVKSNPTLYGGAKSLSECRTEEQKQEGTSIPTIVVLVLVFVTLTLLFVIWRVWRCARKKKKRNIWRGYTNDSDVQIIYDVFISFSEKDQPFAKDVQNNIEAQGYKCCFHHRDFCPGEWIMQSITDAIYKSTVTLVVLSPDYMKSEFCRQELDQALAAAIDFHRVLPVIYKPCKLPRTIRSCVTYLEYKPNYDKRFWDKLLTTIKKFCGHSNNSLSCESEV